MTDEPEGLLPVPRGKEKPLPGNTLTGVQRQVAEPMALEGMSKTEAATACQVPARTVRYWAERNADFNAYVAYMSEGLIAEAARIVRSKMAKAAPGLADKAIKLAEGQKPGHPYQDRMLNLCLDRASPRPTPPPASQELGVKVPTEAGDIVIVWRSSATHPPDCSCQHCQAQDTAQAVP